MINSHQNHRSINSHIHLCAVHLLLLADVLFSARLYRLGDLPFSQPLLLGLCVALSFFYFGFTLLRGNLLPVVVGLGAFALILFQLHVFTGISGIPLKINAIFQFCWIFTFIVFFLAVRDGHGEQVVYALTFYSSAYVIIYIALVLMFKTSLLPTEIFSGLIADDPERGQRLYSYSIAAAFAWFSWLFRFRESRSSGALIMLLLSGLAIALALSRVITLFIVLITFATLRGYTASSISKVCFSTLVFVSALGIFGVFNTDWNPFLIFEADSSGSFRFWEYELARNFLREHFLFGIGIPPTSQDSWDIIKLDFFASSDLGLLGIWFDFGLLGLFGFLIGSYVACRPRIQLREGLRSPLILVGCLMTVYGCIAPVIFYPGGVTYFAVLLGFWLNWRWQLPSAQHIRAPLN